jgi:hypothetical protein
MSRMSSKVWAARMPAIGSIPEHILRDLRESLEDEGMDPEDVETQIYQWPMGEVLSRWLTWNGIIGYDRYILDIFDITVQPGEEYAHDNKQQG